MAEDDVSNRSDEADEIPDTSIPSRDPLPPPPEIQFTRPTLGQQKPVSSNKLSPQKGSSRNGIEPSETVSHGAGLAAGTTFVVSILAGLLAGGWLDQHYIHSSTPWGTLVMTIVGAAVGFTNMSRLLSRGRRRKP